MNIYHFSGGESSAMQVIKAKPGINDIVLFADTKRELPQTYDFIDRFEKEESIYVHRAVFTHKNAPGLEGYDAYVKAYEKQYLPNVNTRGCTRELKIRTAKRFLRALGIQRFTQFIGFRSDEQSRIVDYKDRFVKIKTRFLLNELDIDSTGVNDFWASKPYRLRLPKILKNCDLCFLKGRDNLISIMQHDPSLADKWIKDEKPGSTYIKNVFYKDLLAIAIERNRTGKLISLDELEPAFSCTCNQY